MTTQQAVAKRKGTTTISSGYSNYTTLTVSERFDISINGSRYDKIKYTKADQHSVLQPCDDMNTSLLTESGPETLENASQVLFLQHVVS